MQPQSPTGPNPQFDFIMKDGGKQRRSLPQIKLSKPVALTLAVVLAVVFLLVFFSIIGSSKNKNTQPIVNIMAEAQEISRASGLVSQETNDPTATSLAATVSVSLSSQQAQLNTYLASNHYKPSVKVLAADKNSATDSAFQTAAQNNNLSTVYNTYLKQNLTDYRIKLANEYKATSSAKLKNILNDAAGSVSTILNSLN